MNFNKLQKHKAAMHLTKVFYCNSHIISPLSNDSRNEKNFLMEKTYLYMN